MAASGEEARRHAPWHLRRRHPEAEWVDTDNAVSNGPMLAINERLGFRNIRSWAVWQAPAEIPREWLEAR